MIKNMVITIFILLILQLAGCKSNIIEKESLTGNSEQINLGRVMIGNHDRQNYEISDYEGCKGIGFMKTCKMVVFEDETVYIIESYNLEDSMKFVDQLNEQRKNNITNE
ncbi:hypothetical protein K9M79_02450 [Candidatus Woesearchaeota archaeon]|nr:hypothetical protein [Candidatus Woesearchaeota archaeon]